MGVEASDHSRRKRSSGTRCPEEADCAVTGHDADALDLITMLIFGRPVVVGHIVVGHVGRDQLIHALVPKSAA